jgi:hypothetical protein
MSKERKLTITISEDEKSCLISENNQTEQVYIINSPADINFAITLYLSENPNT